MYSEVVTGSTDLKKLFYVHEQRTSPTLPRYNRYFRGDVTCDTTSLTTVPYRILNVPYVKPANYKRRFNDLLTASRDPKTAVVISPTISPTFIPPTSCRTSKLSSTSKVAESRAASLHH
jgi:hypothetical protein